MCYKRSTFKMTMKIVQAKVAQQIRKAMQHIFIISEKNIYEGNPHKLIALRS